MKISDSTGAPLNFSGQASPSWLVVHSGFELYGSDRMLLLSLRAIQEKHPNSSIDVILPFDGPLSEYIRQHYVQVKVSTGSIGVLRRDDFRRFRFGVLLKIITFFRLISKINQYDKVLINTLVIFDYLLAARFVKPQVWVHVHELPQGFMAIGFRMALRFSQAGVIFISQAVKNSLSPLTNKNQRVIPNGVAAVASPFQKSPGVKFQLLMAGRINHWKGQPLLLDAMGELQEPVRAKVQLTLLGDVFRNQQYLADQLRKKILLMGMDTTVTMASFTDDPSWYFEQADVVIVPSLRPEPFGLVAIEAMSSGKPVIAACHGGLTEIVLHNETGLLFEPGNPRALAEAITFAIQNPEKMKQMGEAGLKRYEEHFTEEIYIRNFQRIV